MPAAPWIKMRTNLADDPAVIAIASKLGCDEDLVVGKLHRMWSWWDQHTVDGNAVGVTCVWLDRYVRCPGFSDSLCAVGWLVLLDSGLSLPKFDTHNGETAKARGLGAKRAAVSRSRSNADSNANTVTQSVTTPSPREEKIRVDKKREEYKTPPPPSEARRGAESSQDDSQAHWGLVGDGLIKYGMARVTDAIREAREGGFTARKILDWLDWLNNSDFPKRKEKIGAGAILDRIRTSDAVLWKCDFGWPPIETQSIETGTVTAYPYKEITGDNGLSEKEQKEFDRLNSEIGQKFDALSDLEVMSLIGKTRGEINIKLRRTNPKSRLELLWRLNGRPKTAETENTS